METGKNGEFAFEVADLLHPATLSIDKLGLPSFREGVPTGQLNLGVIDLTEAAEDVKPKDPPPGIALEFADERPRKLALTIVPTGDAAPKRTDWSLTGRRSPSFRVPAGNYRVRLGAGSAVKTVDVRVDGETVVAADLEGPASR
jgi:hypothetical protein